MPLKILSWNIWCDGHFDAIARYLDETRADIICVQEVLPNCADLPVVQHLVSRGYVYVYAPVMTVRWGLHPGEEMGNAVFSKLPIVSNTAHRLSEEHPRVGLQADIETQDGILHVVSTHLLHTHHAPSELQASQARTLARAVPRERTIVAGDFNALPESGAVRAMNESFRQTDPSLAPTWSMHPEGCSVCNPTSLTDRFDYIFATPDIVTRDPQVGQSDGSDHLPISVMIES